LDSEAAVWAGDLWKELCQNAIVGSLTWHTDEASQAIREEKAPFGIGAAGLAMLDGYPDRSKIIGKVSYTAIPGKNKVVGVASYFGWGIAHNSAHPKEAFEFARWLVSPETEKKQSLMNGQTSCVTANATDPEITSKYPFSEAILESMKEVRTIPGSVNAAKMILRLQAGLSEIGSSNRSAREVLSAIQAEFAGVDMRN
jgi:ABC-type glycerol-3-phosphate transport system substrate-binding protein